MQFDEYKNSLTLAQPPAGLSLPLQALWQDAKGDWDAAHRLAQAGDSADKNSAWVHAYLHRKEGDLSNAGYWYRRVGREMVSVSLEQEWEQIANALLGESL